MHLLHRAVLGVEERAGGAERARVVAILASVLALDSADKGAIGATATDLERAFSIHHTEVGLLLTVSSLVGAAATLPLGGLVDKTSRTRLLMYVIGLWALAMLAGAAAQSYLWLLCSRVFLGAVTAAAAPAVASLIGDYFPASDRSRIYGMVLAGELVGTGLGIAVASGVAGIWSWRGAFAALALPAVAVAWAVHALAEPARGGQSRLPRESGDEEEDGSSGVNVGKLVTEEGIEPDRAHVVPTDEADMPLWTAVQRVLRVRTNVLLIVSSALGYYLFAGIRAFGIQFANEQYHIGKGEASALVFLLGAGGIAGVVVGGRFADTMVAQGHLNARIVIPAVAFMATAAVFAPAVLATSVAVALPLLMLAGFLLAAANPSLDSARLDVMPAALWGRAEATRTTARTVLEALAPLMFGLVADNLFGGRSGGGLQGTFLVMLVPFVASGGVLLLARRSYLTDVATAEASSAARATPKAP